MILAKLKCGLGNQLFQYAAAVELGQRLDAPVRADLRWFAGANARRQKRDRRDYILPALGLDLTAASGQELHRLSPAWWRCWTARPCVVRQGAPGPSLSAFNRAAGDVRLEGYWQSERFFASTRAQLASRLTNLPPDSADADLVRELRRPGTVAVHVRRGDFADTPSLRQSVRALPVDYYRRAADALRRRAEIEHLVVFSDEIAWCRANLNLGIPTSFVERPGAADSSVADLLALAQAPRLIIANSTFSWWAAWIATQRGATVVAPGRWFNRAPQDAWTEWLLLDSWLRA